MRVRHQGKRKKRVPGKGNSAGGHGWRRAGRVVGGEAGEAHRARGAFKAMGRTLSLF